MAVHKKGEREKEKKEKEAVAPTIPTPLPTLPHSDVNTSFRFGARFVHRALSRLGYIYITHNVIYRPERAAEHFLSYSPELPCAPAVRTMIRSRQCHRRSP